MHGCKFNGVSHASEVMLRCCICMRWVHPISCCGDSPEDASHDTCSHCRTISERKELLINCMRLTRILLDSLKQKIKSALTSIIC